jgi:5-hydroxyisourate hydrolase-like protein (transthyretin family)
VVFGVNNTIKNNCTASIQEDKYNKSGIYRLKYKICDVYIGQKHRTFITRFEEHVSDVRRNKDKSHYALHILQCNHEYGPVEETMDILTVASRG